MQNNLKYSIILKGDTMKIDIEAIQKEIKSKTFWARLILSIFSIFALAVNYNLFLLHNDLVIGGTSGISIILHEYFGVSPATFIFIFNLIFIVISFFLLGPKETGMTIFGSFLYPVFVSLTSGPCAAIADKIVLDDFFLIVLISGLIFGTGNGIIYRTGFSTGGVDNLIQIVSKYLRIPTGTASLIINLIIIASGGVIFGVSKAIYAIIIILLNSWLVDKIMLGISDSKMFYITTKKPDQIIEIIGKMNAGFTIMKTEGGYSNKEKNIIMCVVPTSQYFLFKDLIEEIDPKAFIIISDCYEVYGGQRNKRFVYL